jgi:hypothetical protein
MEKHNERIENAAGTSADLPDVGKNSLKDVQAINAGSDTRTGGAARAVLGDAVSIVEKNEKGNIFQRDKAGNVSEFTYNDADGNPKISFGNITRDDQGNINGFKDSDGNVWQKLPADPTSVFEAERNGGWVYENEKTGEAPRSPIDLGNVTIDQDGVHAEGRNSKRYLGIPKHQ